MKLTPLILFFSVHAAMANQDIVNGMDAINEVKALMARSESEHHCPGDFKLMFTARQLVPYEVTTLTPDGRVFVEVEKGDCETNEFQMRDYCVRADCLIGDTTNPKVSK